MAQGMRSYACDLLRPTYSRPSEFSTSPIADSLELAYRAIVARFIILVAAMAWGGCSQPGDETAPQTTARQAGSAPLPFDHSTGFLDGYSLRVSQNGEIRWNGVPVSAAVLTDYLRQYAALPHNAGHLFVAFEPGLAPTRAEWVRRQVVNSGLCKQQRCAEVGWNVKRPVVN